MTKLMQKIVLFIEPSDDAFNTPAKIGHLFMNRFAIDEEPGFEIVKVLELEKTSLAMNWPGHHEYKNFENERKQKGIDLMGAKELFRLLKFDIDYSIVTIQYSLWVLVYDSYGMIHTK